MFALAPEMLYALASSWESGAEPYLPEEARNLPVIGQLYGGKGEMNLEGLLASAPDVVIDIGEAKSTIAEDMEKLTAQTGIPFVHIDASLSTFGETFKMLGELLGLEERAAKYAEYCTSAYNRAAEVAEKADKVNLLYITGAEGNHVIAKDSYHSEVIDLLSNNLAVTDNPSSKGTGNEVDLEQILNWNPDYVIFSPDSIYGTVGQNDIWQNITAIRNQAYAEVPSAPQNWMGFPPGAQRLLGALWMAKLLYPETAAYDLFEQTSLFFELFYHSELTAEQYDALVADSIGRQAD